MKVTVIESRTDPAFMKSCEAWGEMLDWIDRVFWWDAFKLKLFGSANLDKRHGEFFSLLEKYVQARIESDKFDENKD